MLLKRYCPSAFVLVPVFTPVGYVPDFDVGVGYGGATGIDYRSHQVGIGRLTVARKSQRHQRHEHCDCKIFHKFPLS